jgi:hypothetical protein
MIVTRIHGIKATGAKNGLVKIMEKLKPIKIFKRVCPAIIFAKSRIDKLNNRAKYEINSIIISKKVIFNGVPEGKNNEKKAVKPVRNIPEILIIKKAIKE